MQLLAHFLALAMVGLRLSPGLAMQRNPDGEQGSRSTANSEKILTGVVSDALCGRKHAMAGKSAAECTRECVRRGSQHALIVGPELYILEGGSADKLDELAGATVLVSGTVQGDTIRVKSITPQSARPSHSKHQHS